MEEEEKTTITKQAINFKGVTYGHQNVTKQTSQKDTI